MRKDKGKTRGNAIRCAIYTRKSSEEGLEQEFNSLDAQREACEAFVKSQKHEGWVCLPEMYDDGGLSGSSMERPALLRLLEDIKAGKVQIIVVYKVDRLTRSLADFAKIVDVLDGHSASFVSVTQQFNTTTSMGRLTLNMLLSFAQFEREIAGERIRDKIAASKRKGMWMGGNIPLGYDAIDRKLVVNDTEAETVRLIFLNYVELRSVRELQDILDRQGIVSKQRNGAGGTLAGGKSFSRGALYTLLQNPIYRGEIRHQGNVYPGLHERIIDEDLWMQTQEQLATNRHNRKLSGGACAPSLLAGLIVDPGGQSMTATHANKTVRGDGGVAAQKKKRKRYRYYVSASMISIDRDAHSEAMRVPAGEIEGLVLNRLQVLFANRSEVANVIAPLNLDARRTEKILSASAKTGKTWLHAPMNDQLKAVRELVSQVALGNKTVKIDIKRGALASLLSGEPIKEVREIGEFTLTVAAKLTRSGKGKRIVIEGEGPSVDPALVKLLRQSFALQRAIFGGGASNEEPSDTWTSTYRARRIALLKLSYLAPEVIRAIFHGQQPPGLSPKRLMAMTKNLPFAWADQPRYLGLAAD